MAGRNGTKKGINTVIQESSDDVVIVSHMKSITHPWELGDFNV